MELRHLRYFVAVAEEQNITRAAARLHVSQPPLSRQIRDLEDELGVALFERSAKSVRLTEAGGVFLGEARAVLARAHEANLTVKAIARGERGEIHVGYAPSLTVELLPHALRAFQEKSPGVRITLHDLSTAEMFEGLRSGQLHVALMIQTSRQVSTGLLFDEIGRYPVCVAAHPAHPLAQARTASLRAVAGERLLGYSHDDYPEYRQWLTDLFVPVGLTPRLAEEHDGATSLIAAVEAGRGVALVPQSFACFAGVRLKLRPLKPAPAPFVVGIARRKIGLSPSAQEFVEVVKHLPPQIKAAARVTGGNAPT